MKFKQHVTRITTNFFVTLGFLTMLALPILALNTLTLRAPAQKASDVLSATSVNVQPCLAQPQPKELLNEVTKESTTSQLNNGIK